MSADESGDAGSTLDGLERARRFVAWVAGCICAIGFSGLLVLSGTTLWTPENPLVQICDRTWKVSGIVFLILTALPWALSSVRRTG